MIANNITELIGKTPLLKIANNIYAKCEFKNPGGSVKDRIALNMIQEAMSRGEISPKTPIVEPTSGNTGIAIAMIAAALGLQAIIVMPESMSIERRKLMQFLGAKLILTPAEEGMKGAIEKALELKRQGAFMLNQFENPDNPTMHEKTTGPEIIQECPDVGIFVAGVGTGGTITGVGRALKKHNPNVNLVAVEPKKSPVLSGGHPGAHKIQGIGAGFIPKIVDTSLFSEIIQIEDEEAILTSQELAKTKGILVGISSGANVAAAMKLAKKYPHKKIVTVLCDTAERYLSTELFG
ncbi:MULTISPECIES: cysteine synthase A [unclassified Nitratiruptor]|uniref:cysteine synthase A n=1 Tax=unclassified Nitratiruptor TaxID=2624044 RepID=UPI0019150CE8|nr:MULTISPECIES: cysteine synthase A [unclassified Nitratiruptor]BCD60771.1 cysteine synthase [Nitratiruptor sp. YY08-10]BCD64703.1 cysteine synthase [Nitratiruptor sp. YY08-14]